jgi:hypothetical protein
MKRQPRTKMLHERAIYVKLRQPSECLAARLRAQVFNVQPLIGGFHCFGIIVPSNILDRLVCWYAIEYCYAREGRTRSAAARKTSNLDPFLGRSRPGLFQYSPSILIVDGKAPIRPRHPTTFPIEIRGLMLKQIHAKSWHLFPRQWSL